jgi:predicted phage baseplate assembly protein
VSNPVPTWGADAAESVAEAERNIPAHVRHRDRLVSEQDFAEITARTPGVDIGRVEVLPLYHRELGSFGAPGVVTVLVIPASDPVQPESPVPDTLFLDTVCRYLNPRRLITTELHITGPVYVPVYVSVGIDVLAGEDTAPVRERVKQRLRNFLSPLSGGFEGEGWPLDHAVESVELLTVVARVSGVARVNEVQLADENGVTSSPIELEGVQLPGVAALSVQSGEAQPVAELLGQTDEPLPSDKRRLPVPVVPEEC